MKYEQTVVELSARLRQTISGLQAEGTTAMSRANILMMTRTSGLHFANENMFHRAFSDALALALPAFPRFTVKD